MVEEVVFSIIIPTYNSEKVIARCLDSLATQTFRRFEVVIVDGASKDETISVVNTFFQKLNLAIYSEKDAGIYDAMNKGATKATGKWLYFLGSDDFLIDNKVLEQVQIAIASSPGHDVVYGDVVNKNLGRKSKGIYGGQFDECRILRSNICHQSIFYDKNLFKIDKFNLKYEIFADYAFNLNWMLSSKIKKKYLSIVIANFSEGGTSGNQHDEIFFKDFSNIVGVNLEENFLHFSNKPKFLLTLFHQINKYNGPRSSFLICSKLSSSRITAYLFLGISLLRYVFGLYAIKKN